MQYLGGKSRIAKPIAQIIRERSGDRSLYVEPFLGAASVASLVAPHFATAILSDASWDLILLWRAALSGWEPPAEISEERWRELRDDPNPSPERAIAGFGCSFGGKWFAGYARDPKGGRNYVHTFWNGVQKRLPGLREAYILRRDYRSSIAGDDLRNAVYYLDPPYAATTGYASTGDFDSEEFWDYADTLADRGALVFVSEYSAPSHWEAIWEATPRSTLRKISGNRRSTERLYTRQPILSSR